MWPECFISETQDSAAPLAETLAAVAQTDCSTPEEGRFSDSAVAVSRPAGCRGWRGTASVWGGARARGLK